MLTLLKRKIQYKRRSALPVDPHGFESVGDILRLMWWDTEAQMTAALSLPLSQKLDSLIDQEQRNVKVQYNMALGHGREVDR